MKDMNNKALVTKNNTALSSSMSLAINGERLLDNVFNGKNTPYLVLGAIAFACIASNIVKGVMEHKYSVDVTSGKTSVSFVPQKN